MTRVTDRSRRERVCLALGAALWLACDRPPASSTSAGASGFLAEPGVGALPQDSATLAQLQIQVESLRAELAESERLRLQVRTELIESEERRLRREQEWMEYSQLLGRVSPERLPGGKPFEAQVPGAEAQAEAPPPPPLPDPLQEARGRAIERSLRTLLRLEQVRGIDLLECGSLSANSIGPVVFRLLDGSGRLAGGLFAERMRMEASRSAHTLTLVLEDGYETRAGERIPFAGAAPERGQAALRRIVLDGVDPLPWAEEFRELFGENGLDLSGDDGLWDLVLVRSRLNQLLAAQTAGGVYRLRDLGGVQDGILFGVHLERLDENGKVERRLFADRLRIARASGAVELNLESGVQVRGDQERVPFLDGRYRILLPGADGELWSNASIPGLSPPPDRQPRQAAH